ncbi:unnamed protein product [Nippostrongylus brasiliensis]|uniref:Uncharacterized protein n=1 Tax=Nippostrongylus brasiliensis TaxID=27835 RepID=A0A0N4XC79_NIPBR|nr:unnamed protein product [Nippostrongylus brasiliensis]
MSTQGQMTMELWEDVVATRIRYGYGIRDKTNLVIDGCLSLNRSQKIMLALPLRRRRITVPHVDDGSSSSHRVTSLNQTAPRYRSEREISAVKSTSACILDLPKKLASS